jgi:hypothetical protein
MNKMNFPRRAAVAIAGLVAVLAFPAALRAQTFTPVLDLPVNFPQIGFDGSSASRVQYDPATKLLKVDALAIVLTYGSGQAGFYITDETVTTFGTLAIRAVVDNVVNSHGTLGKLVSGIPPVLDGTNDACGAGNGDDFCVRGFTTGPDGTPIGGILLRGEVVDFAAQDSIHHLLNGVDTLIDDFEFHIQLKGGLLLPNYPTGHLVAWTFGLHDPLERAPEFSGTFATAFGDVAEGVAGATDMFVAPLPPPVVYTSIIQAPINANGSSVFKANRGVVPVKFNLAKDGKATCELPPATISLERTAGGTVGAIVQDAYLQSSDVGSNFRIDAKACQYVYNLGVNTLGPGTYVARITVNALAAGSATFSLK